MKFGKTIWQNMNVYIYYNIIVNHILSDGVHVYTFPFPMNEDKCHTLFFDSVIHSFINTFTTQTCYQVSGKAMKLRSTFQKVYSCSDVENRFQYMSLNEGKLLGKQLL